MPEIQRANLHPALLAHLLDRVAERNITKDDLMQVLRWIEARPIVPEGEWFKRFGRVTVCGQGALIKTFLSTEHVAIGEEVEMGKFEAECPKIRNERADSGSPAKASSASAELCFWSANFASKESFFFDVWHKFILRVIHAMINTVPIGDSKVTQSGRY